MRSGQLRYRFFKKTCSTCALKIDTILSLLILTVHAPFNVFLFDDFKQYAIEL